MIAEIEVEIFDGSRITLRVNRPVKRRSDSKPALKFEAAMLRALGYKWREIGTWQGGSLEIARQRVLTGGADMAVAALMPLVALKAAS